MPEGNVQSIKTTFPENQKNGKNRDRYFAKRGSSGTILRCFINEMNFSGLWENLSTLIMAVLVFET